MTAAAFALAGQALAASLMDCTVTIYQEGTPGTPNPVTGVVAPVLTTIYTGPGRVKPYSRITGTGATEGEATDSLALYTVSVPMSVTGAKPGHIVKITSSTDPQLLATTLRVHSVERSTQITARRLTCELIESRQQ